MYIIPLGKHHPIFLTDKISFKHKYDVSGSHSGVWKFSEKKINTWSSEVHINSPLKRFLFAMQEFIREVANQLAFVYSKKNSIYGKFYDQQVDISIYFVVNVVCWLIQQSR